MTTPPDDPHDSYGSLPSYGSTQPPYAEGPPFAAGGNAPYGVQRQRNGLGTASLVLGILAIIFGFLFAPLGIVLGVLAIVFAVIGMRRAKRGEASNRGIAISGLVTGIVGLVIGVIIIAFLASHSQDFGNFRDCVRHAQTDTQRNHCVDQFRHNLVG
jgi:MFS family permease